MGFPRPILYFDDHPSEPPIQPRVNVWWSEFDHIDICTCKLCSQNHIKVRGPAFVELYIGYNERGMNANTEVTVMKAVGFFKDSKCDMIALAMAIGTMRFVAISETMALVLVDDGSLKTPSSILLIRRRRCPGLGSSGRVSVA
jgi:hypothetical protein